MAWTRIDDDFYSHPKIIEAGAEAVGFHVMAMSYCARYTLDGHVPPAWFNQLAGKRARAVAAKLIEVGLWDDNGVDWIIHDWLAYNPSRDQIAERRRKDSERKATG